MLACAFVSPHFLIPVPTFGMQESKYLFVPMNYYLAGGRVRKVWITRRKGKTKRDKQLLQLCLRAQTCG